MWNIDYRVHLKFILDSKWDQYVNRMYTVALSHEFKIEYRADIKSLNLCIFYVDLTPSRQK